MTEIAVKTPVPVNELLRDICALRGVTAVEEVFVFGATTLEALLRIFDHKLWSALDDGRARRDGSEMPCPICYTDHGTDLSNRRAVLSDIAHKGDNRRWLPLIPILRKGRMYTSAGTTVWVYRCACGWSEGVVVGMGKRDGDEWVEARLETGQVVSTPLRSGAVMNWYDWRDLTPLNEDFVRLWMLNGNPKWDDIYPPDGLVRAFLVAVARRAA